LLYIKKIKIGNCSICIHIYPLNSIFSKILNINGTRPFRPRIFLSVRSYFFTRKRRILRKPLCLYGENAKRLLAYIENTPRLSWRIWRTWQIRVICGTQNFLSMPGKYLNVFGECAERIYAYMEKKQKGSWRMLLIRQEI
jgi:hypothetical protein